MLRRLRSLFAALVHRDEFERTLSEELRFHLDTRADDLVRSGLPREDAMRRARLELGGLETVKDECRQTRGLRWMDEVRQDTRHAARLVAKSPGFTAVTVVSLGLGIAANTTIFSFVDTVLFRPAPVERPDELWQVWRHRLQGGSPLERYQGLSYPGWAELREHTRSFETLAGFHPETPFVSWNREGVGQSIQAQFVSGDFFAVCGTRVVLGRAFGPDEDRRPGADAVAVVSHAFWTSRLGGAPGAIGSALDLNGVRLVVVGVAPPEFTGLLAGLAPDVWIPFLMAPTVLHDPEWHTRRGSFALFGVGRLREGVTAAQAEAELTGFIRRGVDASSRDRGMAAAVFPTTLVPLPFRAVVGGFTAVLMGAVFVVLLTACINAANLTLARAASRSREMAVRGAIGASRGRLVRQLLTESVLLALLAGAAGLLLTYAFVPLLLRLTPPTLPIRPDVQLGWRVFAFAGAAALLAGFTFGLAPAWRGTRTRLSSTLQEGSLAHTGGRARFARILIVGQVAACFVLLVAGSLCLRSLRNAEKVAIGFRVAERVSAEVNLKDHGYSPEDVKRFNAAFLQRAAGLPGVESVSLADYLPLDTRFRGVGYHVEGALSADEEIGLQTFDVGPGYFRTMGTTILRGRDFTAADQEGAPRVAVVNQATAERFWPGQDALGRRIFEGLPAKGAAYEVVGVVETGKYRTLGETPRAVVFRSRLQNPGPRSTFVAHVRGDAGTTLAALRAVQREIDPHLSFARLAPLDQHLSLALFPARASGALFSVCGALALLLALSGLFGVIAYSVSRRTREFGIRMALGAGRATVLRLVLRHGLVLAGIGIAAGLAPAVAASRLLRGLLYGVSPLDPITFAAVPALLLAVSLLAALVPARRAANVDPLETLRQE